MSCNCKGARKMQEIFGEVPTNENSLDKLIRYTKRFLMTLFTIVIGIVCIPIVLIVVIYNFIFNGAAYFRMSDKFIKTILGIKHGEEV